MYSFPNLEPICYSMSSSNCCFFICIQMEFSMPEYYSGYPFSSPGDLPNSGIELRSLHCRWILYQLSYNRSPRILEWVAYLFSNGSSRPGIEPQSPALQADRQIGGSPYRCLSDQIRSVAQSCPTLATPWIATCQASLSITNSWSSLRLTSIESVMPTSHLIVCHPLLLLPPIPPSIRVFSNESTLCVRWSKYWSFSFTISPSIEHLGVISFRMDWLDRLAVQGTLKHLLQHHSSKPSIFQHSAFFIVQRFMFMDISWLL